MPKAAGIPPLLRLSSVLVPPMLTEMITPSYPVAQRQIHTPRTMLYTSPGQGRGEVKKVEHPRTPNYGITGYMGGGPWTYKGIQGLHPGNTLSRAHYAVPSLQHWVSADLHGGRMVSAQNSRKPHGQPRNSQKFQQALWRPLVTPEWTYRLGGRARRHPGELPEQQCQLCSDSPGGGATLFQGRPAWVPLFYGSMRVSDTGEHDPCTGFLPVCSLAPHCDEVATVGQQLCT